MLHCYPIVNQLKNLEILAARMHKDSLRIAPVCPILPTSLMSKHQKNSHDAWSNMLAKVHSTWSQLSERSQQHGILLDKFCNTEVPVVACETKLSGNASNAAIMAYKQSQKSHERQCQPTEQFANIGI